ncbi:MAG: ABC transporter permease [Muribaculaceae bacterium]|nr:ABC transporter permease [Muribaculaceae bacterium]MDE6134845.1 ABC transporter permease [Muribaculaceae bacterium]
MFDVIHEIAQTLKNNRLRTVLTGIAVAWGIFMLILLLGAARGVVNSFEYQVDNSASNTLQIYCGRTALPYRGYKDGRFIQLRDGDLGAIVHDQPARISEATAITSNDTATIASDRGYISNGFQAVFPSHFNGNSYKLEAGRFFNQRDLDQKRRVMIISDVNARLLFGSEQEAIGKTVRSLGLAWTVTGVYSHPWRDNSSVPYSTYKALTGNKDWVYNILVFFKGITTEEEGLETENGVRATLARRHEFNPSDPNAIWTWNRFTSYLQTASGLGYLHLAVWVIGIFTLLSGIVGVSNIMFVSVRERTHEIGIRRAIGAKPRSILFQVIAESVAVTAIFGYVGVFLGMAVLEAVKQIVGDVNGFRNPTVDINIAIEVTLALIVAGCAAGFFPALKAIKVKPVEALRDE